MTNGTVREEVVGATGDSLTARCPGGEKVVRVAPDAPVVTFEPGNREELTPGAHVIAFAEMAADGQLASERVVVGKNGLTPPM